MPPHPWTNFEIQNYYQNEPRFNGVSSKDCLLKIKNGAFAINLDEYPDIGTHWIALYVLNNGVTYFDSSDFHETPNIYSNLNVLPNDQQHIRLNKINEVKDYFVAEIKERELMSKDLIILLLLAILISH